MRVAAFLLILAMQPFTLSAARGTRVEYGKGRDLRTLERVFVSTAGDAESDAEVRKAIARHLPMLTIVESEKEGEITFSVVQKIDDAGGTAAVFRVVRVVGGTTYVYLDGTSDGSDMAIAVDAFVIRFVDLLQDVNSRRFGQPAARGASQPRTRKPTVHSTAGLRPGMTKREVVNAVGWPLKIDGKQSFSATWFYETTDGSMRLVFGGDRLRGVALSEKKE